MNRHSRKRPTAARAALALLVCLLLAVHGTSAQHTRLNLPRRTVTLSELFGAIERQTGAVVVFDADRTALSRTVTLPAEQGTVAQMLDAALPGAGYTYQAVDRYILVRRAAASTGPKPAVAQQPTQQEFERDVNAYTRRNISLADVAERTVIRYDTLSAAPHDGTFSYPAREAVPEPTGRRVETPFARQTPPLLAVKTNLVWWAAGGTPNIGGETGLGKRTSLEISGGLNRRNFEGTEENNRKLAHWLIKSEFRYWPCERFNGHFFGLHGFYGEYNVAEWELPSLFAKGSRYEGTAMGGGIDYGYHLPLSAHWGLEFTAGVGVLQTEYREWDCTKCGDEVGKSNKTWFGPTNLGVKVVFVIR
jgi:hypothetical protein